MGPSQAYAIVRVDKDRYRLDRLDGMKGCTSGAVAFAMLVRDRRSEPLGWRLKPLVVMQGARSRVWPSAAAVFASTKLMTMRQAESAVIRANTAMLAEGSGAQP